MSIDARLQFRRNDFTLDVDLSLPAKGITVLFGPSGSGKTTLLRCIAGLETPDTGQLRVNGQPWFDSQETINLPVHQRPLGYVFQEASLFDHLNVRKNLEFGKRRTTRLKDPGRLDHLIELLGIGHLLERRPASLSGGERQRVAIARAMAVCPEILLMDEPLAALDASRKSGILRFLDALKQELSVPIVYVTHSPREVTQLADHLVFLNQGKVQVEGSLESALTHPNSPLSQGNRASTIVETTVIKHDPADGITEVAFGGGQLTLPLQKATVGSRLRIRIYARDITLSLAPPQHSTVQNAMDANIVDIRDAEPGLSQIRLRVGDITLLAHVTRRSVHELSLQADQTVCAQFKASAIL